MHFNNQNHSGEWKTPENAKKSNGRKIYFSIAKNDDHPEPEVVIPVHVESTSKTKPPGTTETVSAFGELNLVKNNMKQYRTTEYQQPYQPPSRDNYEARGNPNESLDSVVHFSRNEPLLENGASEKYTGVYRPTTTRSEVSVASTKKSLGKISEVYSNSGDTVEFAHNLGSYLTSVISPFLWISLFIILALWGMVLILVGSFNLPFCSLQPMIPVYLIVTGSLFIVLAAIRIYSLWPMPASVRRTNLGTTLACRSIEGIIVLAIFVFLILGSIWTFGGPNAQQSRYGWANYPGRFTSEQYCDKGTYWIAFVSIFLHFAIIGLGALAIVIIVLLGMHRRPGS